MADDRQKVIFETKLDDTGVSAGLKSMQKQVNDLQRSYDNTAKKYASIQKQLEKTPNDNKLKAQASAMEKFLDETGPKLEDLRDRLTALGQISEPAKQADALSNKLSGLYAKLQKMTDMGADPNSSAFKSTEYDIQNTEKELDALYAKMNTAQPGFATDLQAQLASIQEANQKLANTYSTGYTQASAYQNLQQEITKAAEALDKLAAKQTEYEQQNVDPQSEKWKKLQSDIDTAKEKLDGLLGSLKEVNAETGNSAQSYADSEFSKIKESSKAYEGRRISTPAAASTSPQMPDVSKSLSKANQGFKIGLRNILKYSLGIRSLYVLFNRLRSAITSGMNNLAQFNNGINPVNTALSSITSSLSYLQNAWAAAFAPILSVVAPVLSTLIDMLASAANALARFFALLGGKSTYTRAVKNQKNYAKSLGGTAAAAKDATDAEEGQLAAIDEVNDIGKQNSGSGGGGGGSGGISPDDMFEEADTGASSEFALKTAEKLRAIWGDLVETAHNLRDAWKEAWDTNDNGIRITQALQGMWFDLLDNIKQITQATKEWSAALNLTPLVTAIADALESLRPVLDDIEQVLVWIWQNAILPIATWAAESLLPAILEVIAGALQVIHQVLQAMAPVAQAIYNVIAPIASTIGQALVNVLNWVADGLTKIAKWMSQHQTTVQVITTIVLAFAAAWGIVKAALLIAGGQFGILTGIVNVVKGAVLGFQTVLSVMGSPVGIAVLAIAALIAIIVLLITHWDEVKETAQKVWDKVVEIWGVVADWFNQHVVQPVTQFFTALGQNIRQRLIDAKNGAVNAWSTVTGFFSGIKAGITNLFQNIGSWFSQRFQAAKNGVVNAWSTVTGFFSGIKAGITNLFQNIGSWFSQKFQAAKNGVMNGFSRGAIISHVSSIASGIRNAFTNLISNAFNWGYDLINGIKSGINRAKQAVFNAARNVASGIRSFLHFSRPDQGPLRDYEEWMPDMMKGLATGITDSMPEVDSALSYLANHMTKEIQLNATPQLAKGVVVPAALTMSAQANQQATADKLQELLDGLTEISDNQSDNADIVSAINDLIEVVQRKRLLVSDVGKAARDYMNDEYERTGEPVLKGV